MKSLWDKLGVMIIVIGFLMVFFEKARPEDWAYYGRTEKSLCFYDASSMTHSADIVEVSEKEEYTDQGVRFMAESLGKNYENLRHLMTLWQINCAKKKFRFLSLTYYSREETVISSWKLLYSSSASEEWSAFVPHSLGENLYKAVCK